MIIGNGSFQIPEMLRSVLVTKTNIKCDIDALPDNEERSIFKHEKRSYFDSCVHSYRYSIIPLALVDHRYRFRFINVGAPGRCHDSHVYQMSSLSHMVEVPLFKNPVATIGGIAVPPLVLCDQAFPLTPNLIKPFGPNGPLRAEQKNFNYHISRVRRVVENAFGRLKARFRFTSKRMECDIANARLVIRACCVLNNICEHFSDAVPLQWLQEVQQSDSQLPQPERSGDSQIGNADSVRSALVDYFSQRMQTQATRS